jgi:hypothetical protein
MGWLLTVLVGGERAVEALLPQPQRHRATAAAALREDGHRPHPHPPCMYASKAIVSCSVELHGATVHSASAIRLMSLTTRQADSEGRALLDASADAHGRGVAAAANSPEVGDPLLQRCSSPQT